MTSRSISVHTVDFSGNAEAVLDRCPVPTACGSNSMRVRVRWGVVLYCYSLSASSECFSEKHELILSQKSRLKPHSGLRKVVMLLWGRYRLVSGLQVS